MTGLDGTWRVERTGGLLPPLFGVRKVISGARGETSLWCRIGVPFRVDGMALRYLPPFGGFVDLLEPSGDRLSGRATFRGRQFGTFVMTRVRDVERS
jgi:hypothetical protein